MRTLAAVNAQLHRQRASSLANQTQALVRRYSLLPPKRAPVLDFAAYNANGASFFFTATFFSVT